MAAAVAQQAAIRSSGRKAVELNKLGNRMGRVQAAPFFVRFQSGCPGMAIDALDDRT
jgi:hypothetical protein